MGGYASRPLSGSGGDEAELGSSYSRLRWEGGTQGPRDQESEMTLSRHLPSRLIPPTAESHQTSKFSVYENSSAAFKFLLPVPREYFCGTGAEGAPPVVHSVLGRRRDAIGTPHRAGMMDQATIHPSAISEARKLASGTAPVAFRGRRLPRRCPRKSALRHLRARPR